MRKNLSFAIVFVFLFGFVIAGCTKYAKEEHLKQLDDTKAEALAAEKMIEQKQIEKISWEDKLAQKIEERDKKLEEKNTIATRLGKDK